MHPNVRNINARLFEKALVKDGFIFIHQKGSHKSYLKKDRLVTIAAHHVGDTFAPKTLKTMINQAGWTEEYLANLIQKK